MDVTKKTSPKDWHPADVIAALRKKGYSLAALGRLNGYANPNTLTKALRTPYPLAEAQIAERLGIHPMSIWPSRYDTEGKPNRGSRSAILPAGAKPSSLRVSKEHQKQVS